MDNKDNTSSTKELKKLYNSFACFLEDSHNIQDWKYNGINEQEFPIIKSEEQNISFSWITFNYGKDE
jgi:hypothetical protein